MRKIAIKTAIGLIAGLCVAVGIAFLTVAAWIALADRYDCVAAAMILGCVYIAVSAVLLAVISRKRKPHRPEKSQPPPQNDLLALVEAFFSGFESARQRKNPRR